jgi:transcription factor SPT20
LQIATEEPLCLDPSFQVTRVSNAIEYTTGPKRLKKKPKYNSVERERKLAKKAENNKLMTLMDAVSYHLRTLQILERKFIMLIM